MKKTILYFLLLTVSFCSFAEVIPKDRAKAGAERFMREVAPGRTPQLQLLFEGPKVTKAASSDPEYFIFSDLGGGFVIASGDDAVPSILGYSVSGTFETNRMPENLRYWLDMWSGIVDKLRTKGAPAFQASAPIRKSGSKLLVTAQWDQSNPFNLMCVEMDGKRAVTGCTATATAIMMRYHQWPESGTGTLPSYKIADEASGKTYTVESVELGTPYDWEKMPVAKYDGTWSSEQQQEVARLMRDVGVMIQSSYSPSGTGAYVADVGPSLVKYMHYDAGLITDYKFLYDSPAEWVARLEDNIDNVGPVVYGAQPAGTGAGHAFIIDGYDERDYLHINWGWSGSGDGYFVMPEFKEYTRDHEAVLGLKKDAGGSAPDDIRIYNIGLSSPSATFVQGEPFIVTCRTVANYGSTAFTGELAFARFDRYDRLVDMVSEATPVSILPGWDTTYSDSSCVVTTPVKAGDYIRPMLRSAKSPEWSPIRYNHESMIVGKLPIGDTVFLEDIVSVKYEALTGKLTVTFTDQADRELRTAAGVAVTAGVSDDGTVMTVDARQLPPSTYTLHLQRGSQVQDIQLVFGLKN